MADSRLKPLGSTGVLGEVDVGLGTLGSIGGAASYALNMASAVSTAPPVLEDGTVVEEFDDASK